MRAPGGRPPLPISFPVLLWVLVELMRDRREGGKRLSVRIGCQTLQQEFAADLRRGRFLPVETIRRHYKTIKGDIREDTELRAFVAGFLDYARQRRQFFGWNCSPWIYVTPQLPSNYDAEITDGEIRLTRRAVS
jgi:hypothetical protein